MNDLVPPWNQYILTFSFFPLLSYFSIEKNFLSTFHTILVRLETIIKRNKKKQLENPLRKSSISQLCTKYWSRLTFLINISLHPIKGSGRLTYVETNLDSLAHGFLWVSIRHISDRWQLFPTKQSEIRRIKKKLQDVISTERDEKWQNSLSPSNSYIYES